MTDKFQQDRATGRAYFTDLEGGNLVDFMFAPHTLDFEEGAEYEHRQMVGRHFNDAVWVSGKPNIFELFMFVDRTNESVPMDKSEMPNSAVERMNHRKPSWREITLTNLARLIVKKEYKGDKEIRQSEYFPNPQFAENYDKERGVYPDLEKLLYYVRPVGVNVDTNEINESREVAVNDFEMYRFTAPPMVRFYYGSQWRECYMTNVKYSLSAMNKELVPRRLQAKITLMAVRWGYLAEVSNTETAVPTTETGESARGLV